MAVNDDLLDRSIAHQIGLQRLSNGVVRQIIKLLNRVDDDIVRQILKYDPTAVSGSFAQKRLGKLLEAIWAINKEAYAVLAKEIDGELRGLAAYEAGFQRKMILSALAVEIDIVQPSASQLFAAVRARPFQGRFLREWYSGLEQAAQIRIRDAIRIGFVEGESIEAMARRIRGTRAQQYRDGILEINRRAAQMVVRTAVNHTANVARQELYRSNPKVVKKWQFCAVLDGRTTLTCASLDQKVFEVGKGPQPPRHPNCRSTSVPVTASWRDMGFDFDELPPSSRASMNGQVAGGTTYGEWLRKQPVSVQDDVLGITKARLFRKGDLPIDRFVDRAGNELTLDELRRREAAAFEKAGL